MEANVNMNDVLHHGYQLTFIRVYWMTVKSSKDTGEQEIFNMNSLDSPFKRTMVGIMSLKVRSF